MKRIVSVIMTMVFFACLFAFSEENPIKVGSEIVFGHYEQDNTSANGKEAIEWIVLDLDKENNRALLLSKYGLDCKRLDSKSAYPTWAKCETRMWLNEKFLFDAFSADEQEMILKTIVKTENNDIWIPIAKAKGWHHTPLSGGPDCEDFLFLLSIEEIIYYGGFDSIEDVYHIPNENMKVIPTPYAIDQGAYPYYGNAEKFKINDTGCGWWWLRSPGNFASDAALVYYDGSVTERRIDNHLNDCVRPAFWLDLNMYENTAD